MDLAVSRGCELKADGQATGGAGSTKRFTDACKAAVRLATGGGVPKCYEAHAVELSPGMVREHLSSRHCLFLWIPPCSSVPTAVLRSQQGLLDDQQCSHVIQSLPPNITNPDVPNPLRCADDEAAQNLRRMYSAIFDEFARVQRLVV